MTPEELRRARADINARMDKYLMQEETPDDDAMNLMKAEVAELRATVQASLARQETYKMMVETIKYMTTQYFDLARKCEELKKEFESIKTRAYRGGYEDGYKSAKAGHDLYDTDDETE